MDDCTICGGPVGLVGILGHTAHGTCRNCGMWYSTDASALTSAEEE